MAEDEASVSGRNHANFFAFLNPESLTWVLPGLSPESLPPFLRDWRHRQRPFREIRKLLRRSEHRHRSADRLNASITAKPNGNLASVSPGEKGEGLQTLRRGLAQVLRHSLKPKVALGPT